MTYDEACEKFTQAMLKAAGWKHNYPGAVYTSRLVAAYQEAEDACQELEDNLIRLGELK